MRGLFISFEGPEGSGKSVQIAEMARRLAPSRQVMVVRAPGGSPLCEVIRELLMHDRTEAPCVNAELLLYFASHAQIAKTVIAPALDRGSIVLADRYIDSTTAYQGYARGLGPHYVSELGKASVDGLLPHTTFLLDIPVDVGFSRITGPLDRIERAGTAFHENVRAGYLNMALKEPSRFVVIDGNRSQEEVSADIWATISEVISKS